MRSLFLLALPLLSAPVLAQGACPGVDDAFENNDTCSTARFMASGTYTDLYVDAADPDFYRVTLQNMETVRVEVSSNGPAPIRLAQFHEACFLIQSFTGNSFSYSNVNITGVPITVVFRVVTLGTSSACANYDMTVTVDPPPNCSQPDALENGGGCAATSAVPLGNGVYPDLNVSFVTDADFYLLSIDPGRTLVAEVAHNPGVGNLNAYLWDPAIACGTSGNGFFGPFVAAANTSSPLETITYTNTGSTIQEFVLEVVHVGVGTCNEYDLSISGLRDGPFNSYCPSVVNSTGLAAQIGAVGSAQVSDNDLRLVATQLPPFSFGFFVVSNVQGFVPNAGGSTGNLCLGGSIGRFVQQIQNSGAFGQIDVTVDLTALPLPNGLVAVQAGETWNFQAWFRDTSIAGPTSNYTDGLQAEFF